MYSLLYDEDGEYIPTGIYYGINNGELARTDLSGGLVVNLPALLSICLQSSHRKRRRPRDYTYIRFVYDYFPNATVKERASVRKALGDLQKAGLIELKGTKITVFARSTNDARPHVPKYTTAIEALAGLEPIDESEHVRPVYSRPTREVRQFDFGL